MDEIASICLFIMKANFIDLLLKIDFVIIRITDGIQPELSPWLGSLVVDPKRRSLGIGEELIKKILCTFISFSQLEPNSHLNSL